MICGMTYINRILLAVRAARLLQMRNIKESCRITLERCERYDAITCGVYGYMMHTAFRDKSHSQEVFDNMKKDLQEFIDKDTTTDEESIFYEEFTSKY